MYRRRKWVIPLFRKIKFFLGILLIIASFLVGKIAIPFLAIDSGTGFAMYLFSWFMLITGLLLCGLEGLNFAKRHYKRWVKTILRKNSNRK